MQVFASCSHPSRLHLSTDPFNGPGPGPGPESSAPDQILSSPVSSTLKLPGSRSRNRRKYAQLISHCHLHLARCVDQIVEVPHLPLPVHASTVLKLPIVVWDLVQEHICPRGLLRQAQAQTQTFPPIHPFKRRKRSRFRPPPTVRLAAWPVEEQPALRRRTIRAHPLIPAFSNHNLAR